MDMIGRIIETTLILQGVGSSSSSGRARSSSRNVPVGLAISTNENAFLPTDATSFYLKGVPVLNAFTGAHENYSTPADTADTLNYEGAAKIIANLMALITQGGCEC